MEREPTVEMYSPDTSPGSPLRLHNATSVDSSERATSEQSLYERMYRVLRMCFTRRMAKRIAAGVSCAIGLGGAAVAIGKYAL